MKKIFLLIVLALAAQTIKAQSDAFISTWVTTTGFETLTLPAQPNAPNYTINWGDGITNTYTATQVPSHTYINSGEHTVSFTGIFPHLMFVGQTKLKAVQQWGTQKWTSMANMFKNCTTFNSFPTQAPDLSLCTNMSSMFQGATAFNQPIGSWNVGKVTNMYFMFRATAFNQDIGSWNVGKVTNMAGMFNIATAFNQAIGSWNVSNVTNMSYMFDTASAFNQDIGSWNVGKVTNMYFMFQDATAFNQPIGSWNVSNVTDMSFMFDKASTFNQPIGSWNVGKVTNMYFMFQGATAFNQPIGSWNVSNVTDMDGMFSAAKLSTANYDTTLIGWATRGTNGGTLKSNVKLSGGNSIYCNGLGARNFLINTYGWQITDGGLDCTGLNTEEFDTSSLKLYPNPVLSVLNVDNNLTNQPYNIIDTLGKVILKGKLNEGDNSINVEQLSKGIYYLKVSDKNGSKFIKD
jgi:surface protein